MRYVAILGGLAHEPDLGEGWSVVLREAQVLVLVKATPVCERGVPGAGLAIVGSFYDEGGRIDGGGAAIRIERLLRSGWGVYVAIVEGENGERLVFRDPGGRAPCFAAALGDASIVFSDIEDARACGWRPQGVDWDFMAALIQDGRIRDARTGLSGVTEILPGQSIARDGRIQSHWLPHRFIGDVIETPEAAESALRRAVEKAIAAAARGGDRILHLLSGGLDSSLALSCLTQVAGKDRIKALTFTQGANSELDEVRYARIAAEAVGVELVVSTFVPSEVRLERAAAIVDQPRPLGYVFSIENDDAELELATQWGASVCTSGAGGDGLFYQLRARTYCADYLRRHGFGPAALKVAYDNARLSRVSFWRTLKEGWRLAYGGAPFMPEASAPNPYLAREHAGAGIGWLDIHPWLEASETWQPGKRLHVWAALDCLNLCYPYRRARVAQTSLPFVSQPVIETVLRIPSWLLSSGGRDRSLIRDTFSDIVPAQILARNAKGAMDGYYAEVCAANAAYVRERLLDGVLVGQGLLDRAAIERDLPLNGDPVDGRELHLLQALAWEVWAAAWARAPASAP